MDAADRQRLADFDRRFVALGLPLFDSTPKLVGVVNDLEADSGQKFARSRTHGILHSIRSIDLVMDGGGVALTTGVRPAVQIHFGCTILDWAIQGDAAGTCTIDVTTSNDSATPSYASIVGAGTKPNVAGPAVATVLTAPSGWTSTTISANQWIQLNLSAVATFKWLVLSLKVQTT